MKERGIQYGYSKKFAQFMYDEASRKNKALRVIAMFQDHIKDLSLLNTIEIGSSTGIMTYYLADYFKNVVGIDIDREGLDYAQEKFKKPNIQYFEMDALKCEFPNESFDTIVCHHTYEHVADSKKLLSEMYRILKPGGLVYFGAPNRLMPKESHYDIYFLSWWPRPVSTAILKLFKKDNYYYERMLTPCGIRRLCGQFSEIHDYTLRCITDPDKFHTHDVLNQYPWLKKIPKIILRPLILFAPDLVFLLKK